LPLSVWKENLRQPTPLGWWAVPRILVGYQFLRAASGKLNQAFLSGQELPRQFERIAADPIAVHRAFIEGIVLQHPLFFSYLVAFGELAIGIALVTGCLVRVASSFGAFHNLNIYLAVGIPLGGRADEFESAVCLPAPDFRHSFRWPAAGARRIAA